MTSRIIFLQNQTPSKPIQSNWHKVIARIKFETMVCSSLREFFAVVDSRENIGCVWIDWEYLDGPNSIENLEQIVDRVYQTGSCRTPNILKLIVGLPDRVDSSQLRALIEADRFSLVVRSDLKILSECENLVSSLLLNKIYLSPSVDCLIRDEPAVYQRTGTRKPHISWMAPNCHSHMRETIMRDVSQQLRYTYNIFDKWPTFVKCLASDSFVTDLVVLDIDFVQSLPVNLLDLASCIQTVRLTTAREHNTSIKIYVLIHDKTDISLLKPLMKMPSIMGFVPMPIGNYSKLDFATGVQHMLLGEFSLPARVAQKFDEKKISPAKKAKLSQRQQQIFKMVVDQGASNKVIANRLKISEGAVKSHITKLLKRYGLRSRTELVAYNQSEIKQAV